MTTLVAPIADATSPQTTSGPGAGRGPLEDAAFWPHLLDAGRDVALRFLDGLADRPAAHVAGAALAPAPLALPEMGTGALAALDLFRRRWEAGLSGSAGPRYLGFVTGGTTPAALLGDWLATAYDQNLSNDGDSAATSVERETVALLRDLFGLPDAFEGAFVSGATMANLVCLATAREHVADRLGVDLGTDGLYGLPPIRVLGGTPHASIEKALAMLGMGRRIERVDLLPGSRKVDPVALDKALAKWPGPAIVVASAGEVNSGEFDDLEAVADVCARHGAWLHVDAAFGLFAACVPEMAHHLAGIERADSIATDCHKWLNVPYDSGLALTRHLELRERVFRAVGAYLGAGPDLLHRTPENSRRFRALAAWMTLVAYGRTGHREIVERCCRLARSLGDHIARSERFDLLADVPLNIVCFALADDGDSAEDAQARRDAFLARVAQDGRAYLTPTVWDGRPAIRAAFSNWSTTDDDLAMIVAALEDLRAAH